jgi:hypothetical protein
VPNISRTESYAIRGQSGNNAWRNRFSKGNADKKNRQRAIVKTELSLFFSLLSIKTLRA